MLGENNPVVVFKKEQLEIIEDHFKLLKYYFNIEKLPVKIKSPLREDKHPSFSLFSPDGNSVYFKDFSTGEGGDIYTLLSKLWGCDFQNVLKKINKDLLLDTKTDFKKIFYNIKKEKSKNTTIECKVRKWEQQDKDYWHSFGITLKMLQFCNVRPISHCVIVKPDGNRYFKADNLAYTFIENKEDKITLKIYQPLNTNGFKWLSTHDSSVISLWTKVPQKADKIVICSSLKDALCLWNNTGIPAIALQGEGYTISNTAVNSLKERYKRIFICFDNDNAGILDSVKLSKQTGFKNVFLPKINNCKDISDIYRSLNNKKLFLDLIKPIFD